MSDIYAMGGTPVTALAILGFSSCDYGHSVIKKLLKGAVDKLKEAGAFIIGGHSIEDSEFKFGLSVTGRADKDKILRVTGATAGDILVLTKPIGIGILTSAFKRKALKDRCIKKAVSSMLTLNAKASKAAALAGAHAATDVTGFGLLGHALNMVKGSKMDFVISHKKVPVIDSTRDMVSSGIAPKGAHNNLKFFSEKVTFPDGFTKEEKLILSDPQTSGGLLIAIQRDRINKFEQIAKKEKMPYWKIGEVIKGKGRILITD